MTLEEILDQALALLQRRGRVTYRLLKLQFQLDDEQLEALKEELIDAEHLAVDEDGKILVWTGGSARVTGTTRGPARAPLSYTPRHLAEKILTVKSALEGERKQVTVLFADLKGSMELLADRDPEEARQLLDPVLERMMAAVHRYEGTVNQVMGDGIMALFGAPIAHEDHAVRACYAALAMQETIRHYREEGRRTHGVTVQVRVGLHSGEVVVRAIGNDLHMDYSAIGQTTHLAARMEQLATPGSALLTAETLRLAEGFIQVNPLGPVPVKGLADPVDVCELVGATSVRRRLQATAARGLTRFVGRQTELDVLRQALERAKAGHGQVVAIVGEPGVGKSRLVYEFVHSHHTRDWRVLESASVSYGKATPYFPVIDLLQRYFGIEGRDDPRGIRAKVTGHVLTLDEALHEAIPALLSLLDALPSDSPFLALDPLQRRQQTLTALKRVLFREAHVQPLLLVFEDLHWIDAETQTLLNSLTESLPAARLLLLVNYRPEYQHGWGGKTYYSQLRLDPLPPASAEALLQAMLGAGTALQSLKPFLIERTQGNPFFLEESVRALVETGVLVGERGAYRVGKPLQTLQVPATVQAVLAARIDRLPPQEKRLLQTAAVIGTEVPFALLEAIAEMPDETLLRGLMTLQAAEFLYETRLFPELEYTFKHALTHEVAYSSLLQERRRVLHARTVQALEALAGERVIEQVERLAHHALRGEVWEKAVACCRQAGDRADDRSAFPEAVTYFEQALGALKHLPATPDTEVLTLELLLDLGDALIPLGDHGRSRALFSEAEALAQRLDDRARLTQVLANMAIVRRLQGDLEGAVMVGRRALELATALGDRALQIAASHRLGQAYYGLGEFGRAAELLRRNVAALEPDTRGPDPHDGIVSRWPWRLTVSDLSRPEPYYGIVSRAWLALTLSALGGFAEGRRCGEEALRLAMAASQSDALIISHGCLGLLSLVQGDLEAASRVLKQGFALCHACGNRDWSISIMGGLGYAYALAGQGEEGLALLKEAVRGGGHTGERFASAILLTEFSTVSLLVGRHDEARRHAHHARELARQQQARGDEALALCQVGHVHAHADPPEVEEAEAHYREALTLAEELGMRPLQAHCYRGLGTLYAKVSRAEQARGELSTAIELYRSMDMTFWLPEAEAALAEVRGR
jgi:class 3 adenylate cyclase/tetratricopeptide (TPR) repeat protein